MKKRVEKLMLALIQGVAVDDDRTGTESSWFLEKYNTIAY